MGLAETVQKQVICFLSPFFLEVPSEFPLSSLGGESSSSAQEDLTGVVYSQYCFTF